MVSYPLFAFLKTSLKPSILHVNDSHLSLECMSFSRALTLSTSFLWSLRTSFVCRLISHKLSQDEVSWLLEDAIQPLFAESEV